MNADQLRAGSDPFQRTHDDEFDDALDCARRAEFERHHKRKDHAAIIELLSRQPRSRSRISASKGQNLKGFV